MKSPRITFLTGAGVSTGAGIPDFRGPQGTWTKDPLAERTSTLSWYLGSQEVRERAWQVRKDSPMWDSQPTAAHRAIAEAETKGHVRGVITQNIDGLHLLAGSSPALVHEVHGNARTWRCEDCRQEGPMVEMVQRVKAGETDPRCPECGGITRSTTILFEEMLDESVLDASVAAAEDCDWIIAAGTSLTVTPVAHLFPMAIEAGARGIILNAAPTQFDFMAETVDAQDVQESLPRVLRELGAL